MPNYAKTIIYKLVNYDYPDLVYVGSTTNFTNRKRHHKSNCKNENGKSFNLKLYQMIRDNGGFDRFKMIEVEKYPCKDKREAERREDEVMKELKASMNTIKSFLTDEERKKYNKEYYDTNKDYYKDYYKEYNETNKEEKNQQNKEYYETNKEKIREKQREKITCECGCKVIKVHLKRHERNKKHINLMNPIQ